MQQAGYVVVDVEEDETGNGESLCARENAVGSSNGAVRELCSWH